MTLCVWSLGVVAPSPPCDNRGPRWYSEVWPGLGIWPVPTCVVSQVARVPVTQDGVVVSDGTRLESHGGRDICSNALIPSVGTLQ